MTFSYLSTPSIPYVYGNILPGGWANFSGQTHVFTIDPDDYCFNPGIGLNFNAINMLNQIGYGNYNINMGSIVPPPFMGMPQPQMPDPAQANEILKQILAPVNEQLDMLANQQANQNIQTCDLAIQGSKQKLEAMLQDENLSEEDKAKVQGLLDRVNEAEEKLKNIKENTDKLSAQEAQAETAKIAQELNNIANEAIQISSGKVEDNNDEVKEEAENDGKEPQHASVDGYNAQVQNDVENFYCSVYRAGTDENTLGDFMNGFTKDNVMDRLCTFNKYHSQEEGESLMKAFVDDTSGSLRKDGCRKVAFSLRLKADELGIYDECAADFAAINRELRSFWGVSNSIYKHFDNIAAKIGEKMGGTYAQDCKPKEKE
jgi:hypothetical protein